MVKRRDDLNGDEIVDALTEVFEGTVPNPKPRDYGYIEPLSEGDGTIGFGLHGVNVPTPNPDPADFMPPVVIINGDVNISIGSSQVAESGVPNPRVEDFMIDVAPSSNIPVSNHVPLDVDASQVSQPEILEIPELVGGYEDTDETLLVSDVSNLELTTGKEVTPFHAELVDAEIAAELPGEAGSLRETVGNEVRAVSDSDAPIGEIEIVDDAVSKILEPKLQPQRPALGRGF